MSVQKQPQSQGPANQSGQFQDVAPERGKHSESGAPEKAVRRFKKHRDETSAYVRAYN